MKFSRFAAVLALAATFSGAASAAEWAVGANIGNVPWEFQDAQGKFVGFEIDLVHEVAKRSGNTVKVENIPFNGLCPAVLSGRVQIAISSITITAIARRVADRVIFMEAGLEVERAPPEAFFGAPREARTQAFLQAILPH